MKAKYYLVSFTFYMVLALLASSCSKPLKICGSTDNFILAKELDKIADSAKINKSFGVVRSLNISSEAGDVVDLQMLVVEQKGRQLTQCGVTTGRGNYLNIRKAGIALNAPENEIKLTLAALSNAMGTLTLADLASGIKTGDIDLRLDPIINAEYLVTCDSQTIFTLSKGKIVEIKESEPHMTNKALGKLTVYDKFAVNVFLISNPDTAEN